MDVKNHIESKPRAKKINPKIDLTSMVSISFLLIVFFMVTVELSKPHSMNLGLPEDCNIDDGTIRCGSCMNSDRIITLLLDDNNKIICFSGLIGIDNRKPQVLDYGKNGIRSELLKKNKNIIEQFGDYKRGAIVIIKPTSKSNLGNLVSILDEMSICDISTYAIVNDLTYDEFNLVSK